jgi:hypothetical protein
MTSFLHITKLFQAPSTKNNDKATNVYMKPIQQQLQDHYFSTSAVNCHRCNYFSSSAFQDPRTTTTMKIRQVPIMSLKDDSPAGGGVLYQSTKNSTGKMPNQWKITVTADITTTTTTTASNKPISSSNNNSTLVISPLDKMKHYTINSLSLLLPAQYPKSVAPGYLGFVTFCFSASIAGSAAMVLSTQTLLLAVGIVGASHAGSAGILAGALNWVMKDFVGQLGGVIFASQMGQTRAFDSDPKRWRMVAAMALDAATLLELLSPLVAPSLVLPIASVANIGKNIGFLTASASRAALHQSLAIAGNLGDVTAKAGSQAIMASLIGTSVGIGLSSLLQHDTLNFTMGFLGLSIIHQGCNYLSLRFVPLPHFNMQRLSLVLDEFFATKNVLSPADVSNQESFFPLVSPNKHTKEWLFVGRPLEQVCPDPQRLEELLKITPNDSSYIISLNDSTTNIIDIIYFRDATGDDVVRGVYHAWMIRNLTKDEALHNDEYNMVNLTYQQVQQSFPDFLRQVQDQGWNTSVDVTTIESSSSSRICFEQ